MLTRHASQSLQNSTTQEPPQHHATKLTKPTPHPPTPSHTLNPPGLLQMPPPQTHTHQPQFAKLGVESYAQGYGKTGHSALYLAHLRATVADACGSKITAMELRQQLAAAELAGIERRDLKALVDVVGDVEKGNTGIGFDRLREVREVVLLGGRSGGGNGGGQGGGSGEDGVRRGEDGGHGAVGGEIDGTERLRR